mgnify:CR=1 FL=1
MSPEFPNQTIGLIMIMLPYFRFQVLSKPGFSSFRAAFAFSPEEKKQALIIQVLMQPPFDCSVLHFVRTSRSGTLG